MTGEEWIAMVTRPYLRTDEPLTEDRIRMIDAAIRRNPLPAHIREQLNQLERRRPNLN